MSTAGILAEALQRACLEGAPAAVKPLVERLASSRSRTARQALREALHSCCQAQNLEVVGILLKAGAEMTEQGGTLRH